MQRGTSDNLRQVNPYKGHDIEITGTRVSGLQDREIHECLNCTKDHCNGCPKPSSEYDKRRNHHGQNRSVQRNTGKLRKRDRK